MITLFSPKGPRVLIQRIMQEQKSSVIEVIEHTPKPSQFAVVLAVGKLIHSPELKAGDLVVLKDFCGVPVPVQLTPDAAPDDCHIVEEDDVLAIVEG